MNADPVYVHVDDVSAGLYMWVVGTDPDGAEASRVGFIREPYEHDGAVAVAVGDEYDGPADVVVVPADARLELLPRPAGTRRPPADLTGLYKATVVRDREDPDRDGPLEESFPATTDADVMELCRRGSVIGVAVYRRNWRGLP
jgi:hypothetical protein